MQLLHQGVALAFLVRLGDSLLAQDDERPDRLTGGVIRASHVSGTAVEGLITDGIYRYSRKPQYLGCTLVLTGLALARRGGLALLLTGALGSPTVAGYPPRSSTSRGSSGPDIPTTQQHPPLVRETAGPGRRQRMDQVTHLSRDEAQPGPITGRRVTSTTRATTTRTKAEGRPAPA